MIFAYCLTATPKELKNKTLLVYDIWYRDKLKSKDVAKNYPGRIEKVSQAEWKDAIVNRKSDYAIIVPVPCPLFDGSKIYQHYIMDCESGKIMGLVYPFLGGAEHNVDKKMRKMYTKTLLQ